MITAIQARSIFRITPTLGCRRALHTMYCAGPAEPSVLFISPVWPERTSSAAGVRTSDLVSSFIDRGYRVDYASTSSIDANNKVHVDILEQHKVGTHICQGNNEEGFLEILHHVKPSLVIFDRFYTEEMFSFILQKHMPGVCRILDMQDVHFLRTWRQEQACIPSCDIRDLISSFPPSSYQSCVRELASIYRSDMTLVCSPRELEVLEATFGVDRELLVEASFFNGASPFEGSPTPYSQRKNMMMIGNFRHPPNADSVEWACTELWPRIRERLSRETCLKKEDMPWLHVYGSYGNKEKLISKIGKPEKLGVKLCGFAPTLEIMSEYRVLFAPLKFGAGLKGKIVDAWHHGLPVVTTVIGSEGMGDAHVPWGGIGSASTSEDLIQAAVQLYMNQKEWTDCQGQGFNLLRTLYDRERNISQIHHAIESRLEDLDTFRASNYLGSMLWSQTMRSTEYFSKWIEEKEKSRVLQKDHKT
jgi:O-antigen biosynthesis protein